MKKCYIRYCTTTAVEIKTRFKMPLAKLQSEAGGREREGYGNSRKRDKIVNHQFY